MWRLKNKTQQPVTEGELLGLAIIINLKIPKKKNK
jgi:hypothetical protein